VAYYGALMTPARSILILVCIAATLVRPLAAEPPLSVALTGIPGPYSVPQWKHDWPNCEYEDGVKQGRVVLLEHDGAKWLRVNFAIGKIGPADNGAGWRFPFGKRDATELRYTMRFSKDFDWVKGGKLPGLS